MVQDLSSIYIIIIITVIKYSSVRPPHHFIHMHHKSILTCASTAPIHTYASYINSCMAFQLTFLYTFHINSMHGISLPVFPHNSYAFHFKHIFISIQFLGNVKYIYIRKTKLPTHLEFALQLPSTIRQGVMTIGA